MSRLYVFLILFLVASITVFEKKGDLQILSAQSNLDIEDKNTKLNGKISLLAKNNNFKLKNKITILNFWASWCTPCLRELPSLSRFKSLYKGKPVQIYTINSDYSEQDRLIKKTLSNLNVDLIVLKDSKGALVEGFGVNGLPVTFVFKGSRLVERYKGEIDFESEDFRRKIDRLLLSFQRN